MPRLSYENRLKVVTLYENHNLHFQRGRFERLAIIAESLGITATPLTMRRIITQWFKTNSVADYNPRSRGIKHTKITNKELSALDRLIMRKRGLSAKIAKEKLKLRPSARTVQKYLNALGWRKIRTKYCQYVSLQNRYERVAFAKICLIKGEKFNISIHQDESTIRADKYANRQWFRPSNSETRIGLVGKYKHVLSVHVIGAISRLGASDLVMFDGRLNGKSFKSLSKQYLIPFLREKYPTNHYRLQMDNSPTHINNIVKKFIFKYNINHAKTPAQSPDLNPIGNISFFKF